MRLVPPHATTDEVRIEYTALATLKRWPRNPKAHDLGLLDTSIQRFGFVQPIMIDEGTRQIVAGHGRLQVLVTMKAEGKPAPQRVKVHGTEWLVPVVRGVAFKDEREAEAYLIADNRLVEVGGWDEKQLSSLLTGLPTFEGTGFSEVDIRKLLELPPLEDSERGLLPETKATNYVGGPIRQIVLFFKSDEYESVVTRLSQVAEAEGIEHDNTAVVLKLLERYEGQPPGGSAA